METNGPVGHIGISRASVSFFAEPVFTILAFVAVPGRVAKVSWNNTGVGKTDLPWSVTAVDATYLFCCGATRTFYAVPSVTVIGIVAFRTSIDVAVSVAVSSVRTITVWQGAAVVGYVSVPRSIH